MTVDTMEIAEILADAGIEWPYSADWPGDVKDAAILWDGILRRLVEAKRKDQKGDVTE